MALSNYRILALVTALAAVPALAAEQLKLVERPINETTVDLAPKGDSPGDMLIFANDVFDSANTLKLGRDQGYCVRVVVGMSYECFWTLTLAAGQITIEGPFLDKGDSLFVITGGSGKFAGAKGSMKLHSRDAKSTSYDFTYDLL